MQVKILSGSENLADAFYVRDEVFTKEQGFTIPDVDEQDAVAMHVVFYDEGKAVATGRTFPEPDGESWHVGRIAVLNSHRGLQLGRKVMEALEQVARDKGARRLRLGAQLYAVPFYEKCGYRATGHRFFEEFCEHEDLEKTLD